MRNNKIFAIVAIVIIIVAAVGAVYVLTQNQANNEPAVTTVTDALGRTVNVPEHVDSIYCMGACSLRLVSYFDAVDKVKAIETEGTFNTRDDQPTTRKQSNLLVASKSSHHRRSNLSPKPKRHNHLLSGGCSNRGPNCNPKQAAQYT